MQKYSIKTALESGRFQRPVTLFSGLKPKPTGYTTLADLLAQMLQPEQREQTLSLRTLKHTNPDGYDKAKKSLPGFMPGHWLRRENKPGNCQQYVPLLVLDFDGVPAENLPALLDQLRGHPFVLAAFYSPSGLRAVVEADCGLDAHESSYRVVLDHFAGVTGLPTQKAADLGFGHIDGSTVNPARHWFFVEGLTENELFVNPESQVFCFDTTTAVNTNTATTTAPAAVLSPADRWELYEQMTDERNSGTAAAGRNGRVLFLAQLAHEHGESEADILAYCLQFVEPDFEEKEIRSTVQSAVKRTNGGKFGPEELAHYKAKRTAGNRQNRHPKKEDKGEPQTPKGDSENPYNRMVAYLAKHYEFRNDVVANELEARPKGTTKWEVLNENNLLHELRSRGYKVTDTLLMGLLNSDFVPRFDPFAEYFKTLPEHSPANGSHIEKLAGFVRLQDEANDREWFNQMFRKMLVRVAAAAVGQLPFNKQCFVLKSDQNDGKSTFTRWLCPPALAKYRVDWTREEVGEKDGRFALAQNFLINLDELATFGKQNIEQTKALMSLDHVKDRPPYGKRPVRFQRRASFFGSTNKDEFLTDESGSVRWLVFEIAGIQHDGGGPEGYKAQIDINAVWAEAWHLLHSGEVAPEMSREEIAESQRRNKSFQVTTTEMELVTHFLDKASQSEADAEFLTVTDIANYLQGVTELRLNKNYVGAALKALGWSKTSQYENKKGFGVKGYWAKKAPTQQSDFR